jgi:hypothetical protein
MVEGKQGPNNSQKPCQMVKKINLFHNFTRLQIQEEIIHNLWIYMTKW